MLFLFVLLSFVGVDGVGVYPLPSWTALNLTEYSATTIYHHAWRDVATYRPTQRKKPDIPQLERFFREIGIKPHRLKLAETPFGLGFVLTEAVQEGESVLSQPVSAMVDVWYIKKSPIGPVVEEFLGPLEKLEPDNFCPLVAWLLYEVEALSLAP